MDMKGVGIPNKLGGIKKRSSPWYLPFQNSLIFLLMKRNG